MHLMNILNHLEASEKEVKEAILYFKDRLVSFTAVREFLNLLRLPAKSGAWSAKNSKM